MKTRKIIWLVMLIVIALLFAACGNQSNRNAGEGGGGSAGSSVGGSGQSGSASTGGAGGGADGSASDDKYPERPITLIIPVAPGGNMETNARQFQKYFEAELGVPIRIENHPGAGTLIGSRLVSESEPDGYTLGMFSSPDFEFTIISMDAPYTLDNFDPIALFNYDPGAYRVHKDSPWNTLQEFLDYVKTQPPGTVPVSVSNITSGNALAFMLLEDYAGVKFNIVAFDGGNPARLALVSKQVVATNAGVYIGRTIDESTKVIGINHHENKWPELQGVPTVNETFGREVPNTGSALGLFAPAGFKEKYPERFKKVEQAFLNAINHPEYLAELEKADELGKLMPLNSDETRKFLQDSLDLLEQYKHYFEGR